MNWKAFIFAALAAALITLTLVLASSSCEEQPNLKEQKLRYNQLRFDPQPDALYIRWVDPDKDIIYMYKCERMDSVFHYQKVIKEQKAKQKLVVFGIPVAEIYSE